MNLKLFLDTPRIIEYNYIRKGGEVMAHAKTLKRFIESRGVQQTFIARQLNMNLTTLNNILNGRSALKAETLEQVCTAMGCSPADFFAFKLQETESKEV
jgi:DNA-binding Xre family transcriptional regulator